MGSGIRLSGMVSGLDTEALVEAMVSTQVAKKEKLQKAQTKLQWKQDAYKSINTKVYGLYRKISNLRFSSAYNMKKTTVSDPTKATITASSSAVNGIQKLKIERLAGQELPEIGSRIFPYWNVDDAVLIHNDSYKIFKVLDEIKLA